MAFAMVVSTSALFLVLAGDKGKEANFSDIPDLENALIIQGLSMESDESPAEDENGRIFLDDSFDDSLKAGLPRGKKGGASSVTVNSKDPSKMLSDLHSKDRRWHVTRYTVRHSDNLWKISSRFQVPHRLIIRYNSICDPERLKPGKILDIPNRQGVAHKIRKGETVSGIAALYGTDTHSVLQANNVRPARLAAGKVLFIPDAVLPVVEKNRHDIYKEEKSIARRRKDAGGRTGNGKVEVCKGPGFLWPLTGRITSGFGSRIDPLSGHRGYHCGIDISAEPGTEIHAAADGTVIFSGWKGGYGNLVVVSHDDGYITVYAHNSRNCVDVNDHVEKGSLVALSGMSGAVTGAHLHFEIRKYLTPLNPLRMFKR